MKYIHILVSLCHWVAEIIFLRICDKVTWPSYAEQQQLFNIQIKIALSVD